MNKFEFFHGAVLVKIIHSGLFKKFEIATESNTTYILDDKIGLYIKYSRNRMPPWIFTFKENHVKDIKGINDLFGNVFITLVCNDDGICCIDWNEFSTIISVENNDYPKWIKSSRKKGEKYFVSGKDSILDHKIGNSDFPKKLKIF